MELLMNIITSLVIFFTGNIAVNEIDVPILMYHHIEDECDGNNQYVISDKKFEKDMNTIKDMGYETITYTDLYNFVYNDGQLPEKPIIITMDDGYESNYKYAYPILKKMNMKATIAVIGVMVGEDEYKGKKSLSHFTYQEAKEMYDSGLIDIQSHTYDLHDISKRRGIMQNVEENNNDYVNKVKNDINKSIKEIKRHIGNEQIVFTYPYGAYDELTEKILKEIGYKITVTTDKGINHIVKGEEDSLFKLKRYNVDMKTDVSKILTN